VRRPAEGENEFRESSQKKIEKTIMRVPMGSETVERREKMAKTGTATTGRRRDTWGLF